MLLSRVRSLISQLGSPSGSNPKAASKSALVPLTGWDPHPVPCPLLDTLSDSQLEELNGSLDFNCFTVDGRGRRFGMPANPHKRAAPQQIPDYRVCLLDEAVDLKEKTVLEVGCFEGVHTIALSQRSRSVLGVDSRIGNIVKAAVRTHFYEQKPRLMVFDLETLERPYPEWMRVDVVFHVGVLYHLTDPVRHLQALAECVTDTILLDTHVAREDQLDSSYQVDGIAWRYHHYREGSYQTPFAGMANHAKWLLEGDLHRVLVEAGFVELKSLETRDERNGRRILLLARKRVA